ncbi:sperm flagellar protein 2 isoform X2 [Lepisosteus oculatus]|uniref:sperm flagellar protein 2 isoform X2 n=1 Tax=Lepisosteus oculatus TaxID=7918 RepID=UPI0037228A2B
MSDILCQWLNSELRISKHVEPSSFAKDFSTGYLIGEVLHKYQLQDDFDLFSKTKTADSKLNNFTRVEPTLQLLGVPFDLRIAQSIMSQQHGVATRLLYQLYIVLQKKKKAGLTGVALETLQPTALAKLQSIEREIYNDRLRGAVQREADIRLQKTSQRYELKAKEIQDKVSLVRYQEMQKMQKLQNDLRLQSIEKHRLARKRQNEIMARIQAAIVQIPKPPPRRTLKAIELRKQQKKQLEAQDVYSEILQFEKVRRKLSPSAGVTSSLSALQGSFQTDGQSTKFLSPSWEEKAQASSLYILKIRQRLEEDAAAREQREKRRRKVLVEQFRALEAQEETYREEQLVNRLTKQSQQERRLAVQLMQVRHEKEVVRRNRIFREKQYEQQRLKEFQEALDREAALAKQAQIDHMEEIRKEIELHDKIAAERAEARYRKHYSVCQEVLSQMVDLVTKVGEYRELTNNLIPAKLMQEWKELFYNGKPLYEQASVDPLPPEPTPEQILELEKMAILDNQDYEDYQHMTGEWAAPDDCEVKEPLPKSNILGHVVYRLLNIINPPQPTSPSPHFPPFTLKACVLGKLFSGKTSCLEKIAKAYHIQILSANTMIREAVNAFQDNEMAEALPELSNSGKERELSARAQLGAVVEKILKKGKSVPDELLVDIIVEAIRHVPAETGWILDGFPVDINQAKLLEKALSGTDPDKAGSKKSKAKSSSIVVDPNAAKEPPRPSPALDLALLLEVSDDLVLDRAAKKTYTGGSGPGQEVYHPSQEGPLTNVGVKDQFVPIRDLSLEKRQIQHRITAFHDTWPKLEKWFALQQNILVKVTAEEDEETVFKKVESVLLEAMISKNKNGKEIVQEDKPSIESPVSDVPPPAPVPETKPSATVVATEGMEVKPSRSKSATRSSKGSRSRSSSAKDRKGRKASIPEGKEVTKKVSKSGSGSAQGKTTRASESSTSEMAPQPAPTVSPSPKPGSDKWVYVDELLPKEIPEYLVPYWENVCDSYITNVKMVMRNLRSEGYLIIHHLYDIREEFKEFLRRPDHKQEFVSQWQQDYNSIPDDMRDDEETKAELHQRLDDLRERLWDICDNRREEAMQERGNVISGGWLEDHTAILINHFSSLMQVEVDRCQDTLRLLRDYYKGMEGGLLPEASMDFACIPLVDTVEEDPKHDTERTMSASGLANSERQVKSAGQKENEAEDKKPKTENGTKLKTGLADLKSKDEQLVMDIWQAAWTAISNMMSAEIQQKEAEEEEERLRSAEREQHRASQVSAMLSAGQEKKKSPKKKGAPSPVPQHTPPPAPEEDAGELRKRAVKLRIRQEYRAALEHEESAVKVRLEQIKSKSLAVVRDLLQKADNAYKEMEEWLGARFLAEMTSIDRLTDVARHHIESSAQIGNELVLSCSDFFVDGDLKVVPSPEPAPRPPPLETPMNSTLTIAQLHTFHCQLCTAAPAGVLSSRDFFDMLQDLTSLKLGSDLLPDPWLQLSGAQIQELTSLLTLDSELIDWRKFLLLAAQPWPYPSQGDLLHTLARFKALDPDSTGFITEEQFDQTELWFDSQTELPVPEDPTEPLPFNRMANLKKFFFVLFADRQAPVARLDYVNMLLYFASHPDPVQGVHRAMSIATGERISQRKTSSRLLQSVLQIDEDVDIKVPEAGTEEDPGAEEVGGVTVTALLRVVCHGGVMMENQNRFRSHGKTKEEYKEDFCRIYKELGYEDQDKIPFQVLSQHPFMLDLIENSIQYKLVDIHKIIQTQQSEGESQCPSS